jgi:serine/threonine protein kinase
MAPGQLEGKDARTDIFAFGSLLHEMVTGQRAFEGKSQASLIGAILKDDPKPLSTPLPMTPPPLDRLMRRCLAKDPDERWQSAGDLAEHVGVTSSDDQPHWLAAPLVGWDHEGTQRGGSSCRGRSGS